MLSQAFQGKKLKCEEPWYHFILWLHCRFTVLKTVETVESRWGLSWLLHWQDLWYRKGKYLISFACTYKVMMLQRHFSVHHSFMCYYAFVSRRGCHILICAFFSVQKICISSIEMVCYWTVLALWENDPGKTPWTLPMEYGYYWCTRCNGRLSSICLVDPCYCNEAFEKNPRVRP